MILFAEDWARHPRAIADTSTTNQSFLRMAGMYRDLGIKNHAFMLSLLQPELQGVDPFSKDLTEEQMLMIALECKWNPWYFFREILRIPVQGVPEPVRFQANRGNLALYFTFLTNVDIALIQPRQTGKSVSTDGMMIWLIYIGAMSTDITMMTKDDPLRKKNVERLKEMRNALPKYLIHKRPDDSDNQIELTCRHLKNIYRTVVSQNSENTANNAGRGMTTPILHVDEGPFINFIHVALPAAAAAGTAARTAAEKHSRPYGNIFTTTAGKLDTREGKFMYQMIFGGVPWDERFVDVKDKYEFRTLINNMKTGMRRIVNATFSYRQLGYDDAWLYEAMSNTSGTADQNERDFLNVWTSGSLRSPLPVALTNRIADSRRQADHMEITKDLFCISWFVTEEEKERINKEGHIIWGLDTSDAVGRDAISLVGLDASDLGVVAVSQTNLSNLYQYAQFIVETLLKYRKSTLVIERKSSAQSIIDYVCAKLTASNEDPFIRLFNNLAENPDSRAEWQRALSTPLRARSGTFYDPYKNQFGFNTTAESRHLLYSNVLMNAAKMAGHAVRDERLAAEIFGLVERNGRIDHAKSSHDDTVIAWLLAHWFARFTKNAAYYGIGRGVLMSEVTDSGSIITHEELMRRQEEEETMEEIEGLIKKMHESTSPIVKDLTLHRIRHLSSLLEDNNKYGANNLSELLDQSNTDYEKRQRLSGFDQENGGGDTMFFTGFADNGFDSYNSYY